MNWKLEQSYLTLPEHFYQKVLPTQVTHPKLVIFNDALAKQLSLFNPESLNSSLLTSIFSGNQLPPNSIPFAQAYAGHQYAHFTMLGDGRAIMLGEHITPKGERFDIQLKGAGPTRYSRRGDGRAALGPMLREFIISEAMHAMGIPTTRSLAVVTTGETVERETKLPGAILTRVAQSHLRVGTFQFASAVGHDEQSRNPKSIPYSGLKLLVEYAIQRHYPEIVGQDQFVLKFLKAVMNRQAKLISQWMLTGFIHGVMNTDNMSICGETIDYGPCAFMDQYHPNTVFSFIDRHGRYAYGNQPMIAQWNLARFAEALLPLLHEDRETSVSIAEQAIDSFSSQYQQHWISGMRKKLGLRNEEEADASLANELLKVMEAHALDYTNTFRELSRDLENEHETDLAIPELQEWKKLWKARLTRQSCSISDVITVMNQTNPAVIPRNHRVEEALSAATNQGDFSKTKKLIEILQSPFQESEETAFYQQPPLPGEVVKNTFCGT